MIKKQNKKRNKVHDELDKKFDKVLADILLADKQSDLILTKENRTRIWKILIHKETLSHEQYGRIWL